MRQPRLTASAQKKKAGSGSFDKLRMTFRAGHLYLSVAFRDTDLLLTGRAGVDTEIFLLAVQIFLTAEKMQDLFSFCQEPLIFLKALRVVSGKHAEIDIDHSGCDQKIQKRAPEKEADNTQKQKGEKQESG